MKESEAPAPSWWSAGWWAWTKRTLLLLVSLGVLALGGYWNYRERLRRQVDEAAAALDAEDPGWRLEQLGSGRAEVRPSENGALVVTAARRHLPRSWPPKELWEVEPDLADLPPNQRYPDEFLRAVEKELAAVPPALTAARTLAQHEKGRFPIVYESMPWTMSLPHLQEAREVAGLLRYDALVRMHRGDGRGALESARAAVNAGRALGDEPSTIPQLVRTACVAIGVGLAERTLALTTAPEAELKAMQQLLEDEGRFPVFLVVARGERAAIHLMLNQLETGEISLASLRGDKPSWRDRWLFFLEQDRLRRYHLGLLPLLTRQVEVAQLPDHEWPAAQKKLIQDFADFTPPGYTDLTFLGVVRELSFRRNRAWVRCAVVGLAVERHRVAKGAWPASLAEVDKQVPAEVLTDPMDGKPLRYRRLADGVAVYSVGSDGTDDGGHRDFGQPDAPGSDVVFRLWEVKARNQPPVPKLPEPGGDPGEPGGPPQP